MIAINTLLIKIIPRIRDTSFQYLAIKPSIQPHVYFSRYYQSNFRDVYKQVVVGKLLSVMACGCGFQKQPSYTAVLHSPNRLHVLLNLVHKNKN